MTAKAASKPSKLKVVALVGGTLADGTHFEAGDELVVDAKQHDALIDNAIVADPSAAGDEPEAGA